MPCSAALRCAFTDSPSWFERYKAEIATQRKACSHLAVPVVGLQRHISFRSAVGLVVANVIGVGIFTTTGFQAADLGNPLLILFLWALGGLLAYFGALCYGELGAAMPYAGAEYVYLRETFGTDCIQPRRPDSAVCGVHAGLDVGAGRVLRHGSACAEP